MGKSKELATLTDAGGTIDGNFGIGVENPANRLELSNGTSATYIVQTRGDLSMFMGPTGSSVSNPALIGTLTDSPMTVRTNNVERMRIDASGRVTMPYQPTFSAFTSSSQASTLVGGTTVTVVYDSVSINTGGHYNVSTGVFTAPVAGHYQFFWSGIKSDYGGKNALNQVSRLNIIHTGSGGAVELRLDSGQSYDIGHMSTILYLNANDYAYIRLSDDGGLHTGWGQFSGYLLG